MRCCKLKVYLILFEFMFQLGTNLSHFDTIKMRYLILSTKFERHISLAHFILVL